jgi:hypothetical protein
MIETFTPLLLKWRTIMMFQVGTFCLILFVVTLLTEVPFVECLIFLCFVCSNLFLSEIVIVIFMF